MLYQVALWLLLGAATAFSVHWLLRRILGWLEARALAQPNHRSLHAHPTPQGGGTVVVPVAIAAATLAIAASGTAPAGSALHGLTVTLAAIGLVGVGLWDDTRDLSPALKLAAQVLAAALVVLSLPNDMRVASSWAPLAAERLALFVGLLWFVNLVNFMDGLDWMSAVETVAIGGGVLLLAALDIVPAALGWAAAAMVGAIVGFMPWNAPPARLFLGDAGSMPLGLLLGALLIHVAAAGAGWAALILPLYYIADATITLGRRFWRGAPIWQAHREHFYQQAVARGLSVRDVILRVALTNAGLVVLAITSALLGTFSAWLVSLFIAVMLVGWTLHRFACGR
jgi:UDP-N-acetylmuramyl pentapeptide phosphotransferase/UDP-N-acetylglucosamine-1-phosphate transferase